MPQRAYRIDAGGTSCGDIGRNALEQADFQSAPKKDKSNHCGLTKRIRFFAPGLLVEIRQAGCRM